MQETHIIMETNPELQLAWQFIENTGTHLFLTGKAGTGKTTFLRRLREHTPKRMVVLAPTGIAAINAGGVTIHSFFQISLAPFVPETTLNSTQSHYRFSKEKRNIIRSMDLLVIDEISMVRADLLDAVDRVLRRHRNREKPFGGVQLLMIGDLQQLAPVVKEDEWELLKKYYNTPYFFASRALRETQYMTIELKKVYRQSDTFFLSLLNKIRENKADDEVLNELNCRYQAGFLPPKEEGYIRLTTHNFQAQKVNDRELASLPGRAFSFRAQVEGTFPEYSYPTDEVLTIKEGAQVMFLKNDAASEKRYYNGMIGEVVTVNEAGIFVRGKDNSHEFQLLREEWGNYKYVLNEGTKEITEEIEGVFRQYPIRLAWAITIHKSQGLTFERAIIDARNSFAHGQTYVALSRCKTLEGMVLESPLRREAIISDSVVDDFTKRMEENEPGTSQLHDMQKAYFLDLLSDLFNFYALEQAFKRLLRLIDEELYKLYPKQLAEYKALVPQVKEKIVEVSLRFRNQYTRLIGENKDYADHAELQQRIRSGAGYFRKELEPIRALFEKTNLPLDNKELNKLLQERLHALDYALWMKESLLDFMSGNVFTITEYLKQKAKAMLNFEDGSASGKSSSSKSSSGRFSSAKSSKERNDGREETVRMRASAKTGVNVPTDILHPELYTALSEWRTDKTREVNLPAYVIMQQKALMGISNLLPDTAEALEAVPYFGAKGVEKYGLEILGIVRKYIHGRTDLKTDEKIAPKARLKVDVKVASKTESKKDTRLVSYEMFCQGMSINEIAKARELVPGTISGHLEPYVHSGEIKLEQVVAADKIKKVRSHLATHAEYTGIASIKAALGDEVSYVDIRLVLAATHS